MFYLSVILLININTVDLLVVFFIFIFASNAVSQLM